MVLDVNMFAHKWSKITAAKFFLTDFLKSLFTFEVQFNRLFAPTSRSQMSKLCRDSAPLGKSNGKKWYQMWIFLLKNGLKSSRQKKFLKDIFPLLTPFKCLLPNEVQCPIFFRFFESLEKLMEISGLRF